MEVAVKRSNVDRRKRHLALYFPERRFGFDRRKRPGLLTKLRDSETGLIVLLVLINLFNLVDLWASINLFEMGAIEGNPVLANLFVMGNLPAAIFKIVVIFVVTITIWKLRSYRSVLQLGILAFLAFLMLVLYESYLFIFLRMGGFA